MYEALHGPNAFDYAVAAALFAVAVLSVVAAFALECFGTEAKARRANRRRIERQLERGWRHFTITHPQTGERVVVNSFTLTPDREARLTARYDGRWE